MSRRKHSQAFKAKILSAKEDGANVRDLGKKYGVNPNQIYKWAMAAGEARAKVAAKGHRMRKLQKNPAPDDVERIVTELLASMRPSLVKVIGRLVDLGVERKLDEARNTVMNVLKRAA